MKSYAELFTLPLAGRLLTAGFLARLGQGITVFAWIVLLGQTLESFARAATVAACLTVGTAISAPVLGRLCDLRGARQVVAWSVAAYCAAQAVLLYAALQSAPTGLLCAIALVNGVVTPPLSAAVRAGWVRITEAPNAQHLRHSAMSAESALFEIIFVLGPLIFSGCVMAISARGGLGSLASETAGPAVALVLSIVLTAGGGAWLVMSQTLDTKKTKASWKSLAVGVGPLKDHRMLILMVVMAGVAFTFGATPVALSAHSVNVASGAATTGVWIAVWSLGSAVGGLGYGAMQLAMRVPWQLTWLLAGLAVGYLAWVVATGWLFYCVLALSGIVIAPAMAAVANLVADYTTPNHRTEAYTWLGTTTLIFTSIGSVAAGGLVVQNNGFTLAMCVTAGVAACAGVFAVILATHKRPDDTTDVSPELQSQDCATTNP